MQKFNLNHALTLVAIIVMMALAAANGYRLQVGGRGLTFEQNLVSDPPTAVTRR